MRDVRFGPRLALGHFPHYGSIRTGVKPSYRRVNYWLPTNGGVIPSPQDQSPLLTEPRGFSFSFSRQKLTMHFFTALLSSLSTLTFALGLPVDADPTPDSGLYPSEDLFPLIPGTLHCSLTTSNGASLSHSDDFDGILSCIYDSSRPSGFLWCLYDSVTGAKFEESWELEGGTLTKSLGGEASCPVIAKPWTAQKITEALGQQVLAL